MEITINIGEDTIAKLAEAIATEIVRIKKVDRGPAPKQITAKREDLVALVNAKIKGVEPAIGSQNKDIIKAVLKEFGANKVPEVAENKIGAVIDAIEERCVNG